MFYDHRTWELQAAPPIQELARLLTNEIKPVNAGFDLGKFVLFNDSTSEESEVQEWAVVRVDERHVKNGKSKIIGVQVESLTCSWMSLREVEAELREIVEQEKYHVYHTVEARIGKWTTT